MITTDEAVAMQGTEFIYEFSDGDTMRAYIKKFDPEVGLSCWSFSLVTDQGYEFKPRNKDEKAEAACCVIGYGAEALKLESKRLEVYKFLEEIKTTGRTGGAPYKPGGIFFGCSL